MDVVLKFSDDIKAYQFLLVLLTSAGGALVSVPVVAKWGLQRSLVAVLVVWTITVAVSAFITSPLLFTFAFALIGFLNGAVWNISRVFFFVLTPAIYRSAYFGVYSSFERFASILGPLVWSLPVTTLISLGTQRYQLAWFSMAAFLAIGCVLIAKMPPIQEVK